MSTAFYDQCFRLRHKYRFRPQQNGLMFMIEVSTWFYRDDNEYVPRNQALANETVRYTPEGIAQLSRSDKVANVIEKTSYRNVDVSSHWEPVPAFGEWASISRFNRES